MHISIQNMKKYIFTVVIEKDSDANMYVGEVPGIPGCHTQGETIDELMENMREVIELCIESRKEQHTPESVPKFVGVQQIEVITN